MQKPPTPSLYETSLAKHTIVDTMGRPTLHVMATMACNLRCSYCPVSDSLLDKPTDKFLQDALLNKILTDAKEPYYAYLGGGEPLLSPDLPSFLNKYGKMGHKFSFDSNGTHNVKWLAKVLNSFDTNCIGYFDISHHLDQKVPLKTIIRTCEELKSRGINHYVKYIGRPCDMKQIDQNIKELEARGIGTWVALYIGPNTNSDGSQTLDNRILPGDYTKKELKWLLGNTRLRQYLPPLYGGLKMQGLPCRAGGDYVVIGNMGRHQNSAWPCCHGESHPVDLNETYFRNGNKDKKTCPVQLPCLIYSVIEHGMLPAPEETIADLFKGPVKPLSPSQIVKYVRDFCPTIAPPADPALYQRVLECALDLEREPR